MDSTEQELQELQKASYKTRRVISEALEDALYTPIPVLDHGFIRVIDYMGNDSSIVQAARVSYGTGTKKLSQDKGLINYLMRHRHTTPFEMCDIKFHIKLPIFVARQWIRHRTASVNEYSARYSILNKEFYIPHRDNLLPQSTLNKQGREDARLSDTEAERVLELLKDDSERNYTHYQEMMNADHQGEVIDQSKQGIARELARMNLSLNYYTEWYWKINLHNLLHFASLRADPHAQYEIRVYADIILDLVKKWVPFTYEAFEEHVMHGVKLSRSAFSAVKDMLDGKEVTQESSGMSPREWREFHELLNKE